MKPLKIGEKTARLPIIQGGMGVGVSLSSLAGAVAACGGVGVISSAQIGFLEPDFEKNPFEANLRALKWHIKKAKEQVNGGLIAVNVMFALQQFEEHVRTAAQAGADIIISGAGLAANLPELVTGTLAKIAPIVSSEKAAKLLLKMWDRHYGATADMIVVEGPGAGGHLGFTPKELAQYKNDRTGYLCGYDAEIKKIIKAKQPYEEKYGRAIPVIVAGGIFDHADVEHALSLGADGVQVASRFVATDECDASDAYKQAYIRAKKEDIRIIKSPVGMPGRALENEFIRRVDKEPVPVQRCLRCIKKCNPATVPYCITRALIDAVKGDVSNGLVFCGDNTDRIQKIVPVRELMEELAGCKFAIETEGKMLYNPTD